MRNPGFIVGGGPSLKQLDWSQLDECRCLTINEAFRDVPHAVAAYIGDTRLIEKLYDDEEWRRFSGVRFARRRQVQRATEATEGYLELPECDNWTDVGGVVDRGLSGIAALSIADRLLQWDPIILLGFDCQGDRGDGKMANYHDRYPTEWAKPEAFSRGKFTQALGQIAQEVNAKVYNVVFGATPLDCFERIDFERAQEIYEGV